MNIKELSIQCQTIAKSCNRRNSNPEVYIKAYRTGFVDPVTPVKIFGMYQGYEYDKNKVIIIPSTILMEISESEKVSRDLEFTKYGWMEYENNNLKLENKKLRKSLEESLSACRDVSLTNQ